MSDAFSVLSLNVRGTIKNPTQRAKLLMRVKLQKINIIMLQETHVNNLKIKSEIDKNFDC